MRKTRQGADRIRALELRGMAKLAQQAIDTHEPLCYWCKRAGTDVYGHCSVWWALARELHTARRFLGLYEQPETEGELTLFEVDDQ